MCWKVLTLDWTAATEDVGAAAAPLRPSGLMPVLTAP